MKHGLIAMLMMILMLSAGSSAFADRTITAEISFDPADLIWETIEGYDIPRLADCDIIRQVGAPQLPACAVQMVIPADAVVERIEVAGTDSRVLTGRRRVYPSQPAQILSLTRDKSQAFDFVPPKGAIYHGEGPFPGQIVEFTGSGTMGDTRLANLVVFPLQYLPREEKIRFHERIEFVLYLAQRPEPRVLQRSRSPEMVDPVRRTVGHLVLNAEDLEPLSPVAAAGKDAVPAEDLAEYVIVTDPAFAQAFQELADWKTKKGVPAQVVTLDEIDDDYPGADRRERVRAFITDAYQNLGTVYVLLAGDTQTIPCRYAYAMDSETAYNDIPCDLYYADLDGDWNADGDETFGEVEDEVDLYPEVFLGRAPVSTVAQAETFVDKVLTYEKPTFLDYQEKAMFAAAILWWDPYTDASESKELIDERYLPERFDPITKLYESRGNEDLYGVINAMNSGMNIFNHDGHAYYSVMGVGEGYLENSHMDNLSNGERIGLLYSIGCWPAAFDYDCIAEHYINNPDGGGVAFIGNSRYGWGSPGNPCFGYSDRFDQHFFKTVFQDGIPRLGEALATTKAHYAPRSRQENVYRWHQYELTLLGDPETPLWTRTPQVLAVEHPEELPPDTSLVVVSVSDGGKPVQGALVCLMGDDEVYERAATDLYGKASITLCPASEQTISVTATAADFLPYEGQMTIFASGPHLAVQQIDIQEISGNGDGVVSPGERIGLGVSLKNWGNETAAGVTATIGWEDEYITRGDSVVYLGDIAPGEVISSGPVCCFTVAQGCPDEHPLCFALRLTDAFERTWSEEIGIAVATPVLSFQSSWLDDGGRGNGNGVPEAGEDIDLHITLANAGGELARDLAVQLEVDGTYLDVVQSPVVVGDVPSGSTGQAVFQLHIEADCPEPVFPLLELSGSTSDGYIFQQNLLLTVGRVGFFDDLEGGSNYWSHWHTSPDWHFTGRRTHSGSTSWYCGEEGTTSSYLPDMDCALTALPLVVGTGTKLSFWHWYDLATYGSDGLYVEVNTGSGWEILDFLGSGGALDSLLIGNDWFQDTYDLSHVLPGTFLQIRFRFQSDDDEVVAEGVYVDDVSITCDVLSDREQTGSPSELPLDFRLSQNHPNPFNATTQLVLNIPTRNPEYMGSLPVNTTIVVYNINGQKVKTLLHRDLAPGEYRLIWDGKDDQGYSVGSGIFFCRVEAGLFRQTRKMVLLR